MQAIVAIFHPSVYLTGELKSYYGHSLDNVVGLFAYCFRIHSVQHFDDRI